MAITTVGNNQTSSGVVVTSGNTIQVLAGGRTASTVVSRGGFEILSGGLASGTTMGGDGTVLSGGQAFGTTIVGGGSIAVSSGGTLSGATFVGPAGGAQSRVASGGTAFAIAISGSNIVNNAGLISGVIVNSSTLYTYGTGLTYAAVVVHSGRDYIQLGGTSIETVVSSGGIQTAINGGASVSATVSSGGQTQVDSGGSSLSASVVSGGLMTVYSGGVASGTVVRNGGSAVTAAGGVSVSATIMGGVFSVLGIDVAATLSNGGTGFVASGGVASGTVVSNGSILNVNPGAVLSGGVISQGGVLRVNGTATGTVVSGGSLVLSGILVGATVAGSGTAGTFSSGVVSVQAGGIASATVLRSGGGLFVLQATARGSVISSGGAEIVVSGGQTSGATISSGGQLTISSGGAATGITLLSGGRIDLAAVAYNSSGTANLDRSTNRLTVTEGATVTTLQLAGDYTNQYFHIASDFGAGTYVTVDGTPCYCHGTLILTDRGEVAAEELAIGDVVVTAAGRHRTIRWIGRRGYGGRFAAGKPDILPVLIRAGALDDCVPRRDLMVSPLHAMFVEGVLVPAAALVNGRSIVQLGRVERVDYVHVELDTHDVILAEGAPSETFVDDDSRGMFINAGEYRALYPDAPPALPRYCAPRVEDGPVLQGIRRRLGARAGGRGCGCLSGLTPASAQASAEAPPNTPPVDSGLAGVPPDAKPAYPPPAGVPTQAGAAGIRFDFNHGARVVLPPRTDGAWRVRLRDLDTGNILFESENQGATVLSTKRWYVRFGLEVWSGDDDAPVLSHSYDAAGREVLIQFPVGTLGDILAWFPYAARFAEAHPGARVTCALSGLIIPLLAGAYPGLRLVTHEEMVERKLAETFYATYSLGLFFDDVACEGQPTDFRHVGLHKTAAWILGVARREEAPRLAIPDDTRPIAEPYAVIAVQSSSGCKYWNNPDGWREVVAFLKAAGYRVVCIDQKPVHGHGLMWTHIPHGAEDETGDRPLAERARWLRHAAVYIGLSSGLSWLAWAAGAPVVLISGFTHPTNEFETPYRVINWHACNSCWNDPALRFDHHDFLWCPRHKDTPRHFECTRLITAAQVTQVIAGVPGFGGARG